MKSIEGLGSEAIWQLLILAIEFRDRKCLLVPIFLPRRLTLQAFPDAGCLCWVLSIQEKSLATKEIMGSDVHETRDVYGRSEMQLSSIS